MAEQAQDPAIARIHLDLAEHYAGRVRAARAQEKLRTDVVRSCVWERTIADRIQCVYCEEGHAALFFRHS